MEALTVLIPFTVAMGAAVAATPLVSRMARALGVVDLPDARKVNRRPDIPLLGGIAVAVGCIAGMGTAVWQESLSAGESMRLGGLLAGGAILLGLGAYDDRFGLDPRVKLVFQIIAASIAFASGFRVGFLTEPFSLATYELPIWLAFGLSILWIVAVTNAINFMDGLDGLATGIGTIIAITLTWICYEAGQPLGVLLGVALVGSQLGFLPFNFPPGRIFLGDTGAYFIGYMIAVVALEGYRKTALLTFVVPLMALAVPLLDTLLSVFRRLRDRQAIMSADRQHMHHHLLKVAGGSQRNAVLSLYFLTSCFCIIAVAFRSVSGFYAIALLVAVLGLTVRLLRNLGLLAGNGADAPSEPDPDGRGSRSVDASRGDLP